MEFRILGPLEALEQGRAVRLGGSKQQALLAVFLLHANETLSTDRLIDELWGERPPATAAKTVRVYVSRLRRALAGGDGNGSSGVLATRGHGYELRLDPERLDARRFERLVAEGRGELTAGRPARAAATLEAGLSLWRGPVLADLAYEPVVQPEAARLEELRIDALELLIEAKLALGAHAEVIARLETLIAEHPYRERPRGQLMLALYRSDRQADALQAYQDARRALVEQLGIEPGERLRELERAILGQDPRLDLPAAEQPAGESASPAARSVFVGRERELEELTGGLDDALAGRGRLFLLVGEPGIGKSRLAEELVARATARGTRVLVGRCWEAGGAPAYWPWVQALRGYVRDSDSAALRSQLGAGAADLAQLLPELRERFPSLPEPPAPESDAARFRLFDAVAEFLRRACESRPGVLVLDDLHAGDAPSLLLLRFVTRQLGATRMLVLGAYRDVDPLPGRPLTEMLAEVTREPVTRRLSLGGLSEREVAQYVECTASPLASTKLVAALHEETEGNPLFVGEIVRLLAIEGALSSSPAELRLAVPQGVRDVITRRLSHLSRECNRLLVLASVLGREFALAPLARIAGVSEDRLLDVLDEAMRDRVVSDVPAAAGRSRFAHVLFRDTVYDGLTSAGRLRLHRLVLDALEALYGEEPGPHLAELAHHAVAGRDLDKGVRYARRAGDRALALLAYEEAARLYETALQTLDLSGASDERAGCGLLLSLGEAKARAGHALAAKRAFIGAADIARRLGLPSEFARAAAGYGGRLVWARAGTDDRLVPLLEEGLAALGDEDVELRARLLARLAGALRDEPSRDRRDALSREAVELARRTDNPAALAYALDGRALAIVAPDTVAESLALGTELREVAERSGDTERVMAGHTYRIVPQLWVGDMLGVEADLAAASRIARAFRQPAQLWLFRALEAMLALGAGNLVEAEELIAQAFALGERAQPEVAIPAHAIQRYTLCDFRGTLEDIEPALRELVLNYPARPVFRCTLARVYARLARLSESKRLFDELARDDFSGLSFDLEWLYGMSELAEASALLGDTDAAAALYRLLLPWAALNSANPVEGIRGSVSRYLGILATATKRWKQAELHFKDAVAMNERVGARPWVAHTKHDYARMLAARDETTDRERALELIAEALTTYRELGMESWAEAASELERALSPASPPAH